MHQDYRAEDGRGAMAPSRLISDRAWAILISAGALAIFLWNVFTFRMFIDDDTYISLRYAVHLAQNGEITWNLGERVEGYTNFLQIILTALPIKLGLDPVYSVRLVNAAAVAGLFVAVVSATRRLVSNDPVATAVGGFFIAASAPVALWIWGGLEADLTAALVAGAVAVLLPVLSAPSRSAGRCFAAGLLFGLAYLSRPDALVTAGVGAAGLLYFPKASLMHRIRLAVILGGTAFVIVAAHLAWRLSYYGDPLPNTYYAKMALPLWRRLAYGAPYVLKSMLFLPAIPLGLAGAAWAWRAKATKPEIGLLAATLAAYLFVVVWVGGDHMYGARMLVPMIGPGCLLLVAGLEAVPGAELRRGLMVILVFVQACISLAFPRYRMDMAAFGGTLVGKYIDQHWAAGSLVALHTAGSTPYFAPRLRYIDMLGLNDRVIAHRPEVPMHTRKQWLPGHSRGDGAYVLRRAPDYIIAGPAEGTRVETPVFLTDFELADLPEFHRCYVAQTVAIPYSHETAALDWLGHPRPLIFTYYRRAC
jgi:hypothetical protein